MPHILANNKGMYVILMVINIKYSKLSSLMCAREKTNCNMMHLIRTN